MFRDHPKGLKVLFFTEIWERFGFYILMAIFVLYMDHEFKWSDAFKGKVYGLFLFIAYFFPLVGGWLSDKVIGAHNTIRVGAVLMGVGYALLAGSAANRVALFFIGLVMIAVGTGIFKVNMSVSVGNLYEPQDGRKDSGFNIYYMGVNIGAMLAPLAATYFHNAFDSYRISFAAAAVGMILSMIIFESGKSSLVVRKYGTAYGGTMGQNDPPTNREEDRQRIATLGLLFLIVIFFWITFYQNGFALTLFAQRSTILSDLLKPETYQFFNPFFILLLTPVVVNIFNRMRNNGKEPTNPTKIFIGMFISGFSMLIMAFASLAGGDADANIMSPWWLIASYFVVTLAEILVSPMGQSFVTKVAPRRIQGMMMGLWFVATAVGSSGSGFFGRFYSTMPHHQYFFALTGVLLFLSLLVFFSLKRLNRFST
ncbi:MAG: peptide MFS transporter [candidate division KSB1 bacterium]|nr:peptide MFS transporter [candidate division KSB1 bacterium]MDZ7301207.1 peptide MFS transporter [candidate division KSB1 bacterium]MDZ7310569.1 peptide MFS transporter [candidate division KSB1 bacterium]